MDHNPEKRRVKFIALYKNNGAKPCAILMTYQRIDNSSPVRYLCIPTHDASTEIWNKTLDFINNLKAEDDRLRDTFIWALMHFSAQEIAR